jgi:hypothetical protein
MNQDDAVTKALKNLGSRKPSVRTAAKAELVAAGSLAIEPVMSLLSDLIDRAAKARRAIHLDKAVPLQNPGYESDDLTTWSLLNDCCEVLGRLRATRAIGLLIRVIEVDDISLMLPRRVPAIHALELIGKPAEAALIEEFKNVPEKLAPLVGQRVADADKAKLRLQEQRATEIRVQVSLALELIGDAGTVEALNALLETDSSLGWNARAIIETTITQIRARLAHRPDRKGSK